MVGLSVFISVLTLPNASQKLLNALQPKLQRCRIQKEWPSLCARPMFAHLIPRAQYLAGVSIH